MTKKQLIDALANYPDDQYICVLMYYGDQSWRAGQMLVQGLREYPAWHGDNKLLGLVIHESNGTPKILKDEKFISFDGP